MYVIVLQSEELMYQLSLSPNVHILRYPKQIMHLVICSFYTTYRPYSKTYNMMWITLVVCGDMLKRMKICVVKLRYQEKTWYAATLSDKRREL